MKVVIELPEGSDVELEGLTDRQLRTLMMDALSEFVMGRGPTPEEYVNRRYPDTPGYAWEKVREVRWRCHVANVLHGGDFKLEVT